MPSKKTYKKTLKEAKKIIEQRDLLISFKDADIEVLQDKLNSKCFRHLEQIEILEAANEELEKDYQHLEQYNAQLEKDNADQEKTILDQVERIKGLRGNEGLTQRTLDRVCIEKDNIYLKHYHLRDEVGNLKNQMETKDLIIEKQIEKLDFLRKQGQSYVKKIAELRKGYVKEIKELIHKNNDLIKEIENLKEVIDQQYHDTKKLRKIKKIVNGKDL